MEKHEKFFKKTSKIRLSDTRKQQWSTEEVKQKFEKHGIFLSDKIANYVIKEMQINK